MILGIDVLLGLVYSQNLVEGLSEREMRGGEGTGFDLRIGKLYRFPTGDSGFLGITERKTPNPLELVASYSDNHPETHVVSIDPGKYYLMTTVEKVNMPPYLLGLVAPRTTLFRSGVSLLSSQVAPGYSGELTFALVNLSAATFVLEMGARVAHLMFFSVVGSSIPYEGQWQGGRVSTALEIQH